MGVLLAGNKMKNILAVLKRLIGSYEDWSGGAWVHYTDVNKLGVNPKQFHQDLAGIYLFPQDFETKGTLWKSKKYKITVKIKDTAKILDLSKLTKDDMFEITDALEIPSNFTDSVPMDADQFWESLKNYYMLRSKKQPGKWAKDFIKLGYDAIFDDTDSIHYSEVQVVVLNPKILEVVDVVTQNIKRGQFGRISEHLNMLAKLLKPFGKVEIEPLVKSKDYRHRGKLKLNFEDNKYISWEVEEDEANQEILVKATGSNISGLRDNWGHFGMSIYMKYGNEAKIKEIVEKVMKRVEEAGEEKAA